MTLTDIAELQGGYADETTKRHYHWAAYEPYFAPLSDLPIKVLEIGLHRGNSLRVLATYFRRAKIVGVDCTLPVLNPGGLPNVSMEKTDQRDGVRLAAICEAHAPGGFDIIIDDASHIGAFSLTTFNVLFPRLKAGGLYMIEDWCAGYMKDWPDGAEPSEPKVERDRITSHDFGMVGFVKSLMDSFAADQKPVAWMHVHFPVVVVKKAEV